MYSYMHESNYRYVHCQLKINCMQLPLYMYSIYYVQTIHWLATVQVAKCQSYVFVFSLSKRFLTSIRLREEAVVSTSSSLCLVATGRGTCDKRYCHY